eukprot:TRINITY_DN35804_c0_g1_i1.p2 TRINITY_DN35804_c0_g1~~TRINITY_DN35804_c0_g1_i1.p2  ORF type:complete len:182 (+),score=54.38 TRINITY_DN35804_c0_g1_i1:72-617(+)
MSAQLDRAVRLLKTTDGRDRLYQLALGLLLVAGSGSPERMKWTANVVASVQDCRRLLRFLAWTDRTKAVELSRSGVKGPRRTLALLAVVCEYLFLLADNVCFLHRHGLISVDLGVQARVLFAWARVMRLLLLLAGGSGSNLALGVEHAADLATAVFTEEASPGAVCVSGALGTVRQWSKAR